MLTTFVQFLGLTKYFRINEKWRGEKMQRKKDVSQSGEHKNDRQKPFLWCSWADCRGCFALCSVWMLTDSYNCTVYSPEIISILSRKECRWFPLPHTPHELWKWSINTELCREIIPDAQQTIFSPVFTVSLFEIISQTVALSEEANHCFFSVCSLILAWGDADVKPNDITQNMLWNLSAEQLPKQHHWDQQVCDGHENILH